MASTAAGGERRAGPVMRFLRRASHYQVRVLCVVIVCDVATWASPEDAPWALPISLALTAAMIAVFAGQAVHETWWPCDYCSERFPLDAAAKAAENLRWLRLTHYRRMPWLVTGTVVWSAAGAFLLGPTGLGLPRLPLGILTALPLLVLLTVAVRATTLHRELQPWCPMCRRRDEDDDPIDIPVPTPPSAKVDA